MNKIISMAIASAIAISSCTSAVQTEEKPLLWLSSGEPNVEAEVIVDPAIDIHPDGFIIRDTPEGRCIMAKTETGALYGMYALDRMERTGQAEGELDIIHCTPCSWHFQ